MLLFRHFHPWLVSLFCMVGLISCSELSFFGPTPTPKAVVLPKSPLYVVATGILQGEELHNQLVVLDAGTFQEANRTELLETNIWHASLDPKGRLWIGYAGGVDFPTKQVDVFNPDGRLLKTLETCSMPNSGVQFAAGRAFVACMQNGFYGRVVVVDLESLATLKTIDVKTKPSFLMVASAANEHTVIFVGGSETHTTVVFVDPHTLEIQSMLPIYGGLNPKTILPYQDRFYLLNRASYLQASGPLRDLFLIQPGNPPSVTSYTLPARVPLYGFITGAKLYAYHNPSYELSNDTHERSISEFDLKTGKSINWPLPNDWDADQMQWVNGQITLTHSQGNDTEKVSGLYTFDPTTQKLTQILYLRGAQLLVTPYQP